MTLEVRLLASSSRLALKARVASWPQDLGRSCYVFPSLDRVPRRGVFCGFFLMVLVF